MLSLSHQYCIQCAELRADTRLAPSQWETSLQSNAVSHWLDANLESAVELLFLFPAPDQPQVSAQAVNSTAIHVTWEIHPSGPDVPEVNGYQLNYREIGEQQQQRRVRFSDLSRTSYTIGNLSEYCQYFSFLTPYVLNCFENVFFLFSTISRSQDCVDSWNSSPWKERTG